MKPISLRDIRMSEKEDFRLAASLIHRKQKRLFKKMLHREKSKEKRGKDLRSYRKMYEEEMLKKKKTEKKLAKGKGKGKGKKAGKN